MKILYATSESVPYVKTGGLADVAYSLPKALVKKGHDVRVIMPLYGLIEDHYKKDFKKVAEFTIKMSWRNQYCGLYEGKHEGVTYYFVDNEYYFSRDRLYGHYDEGEIFSFFSKAILDAIMHIGFTPDVLHLNDWHTAMAAVLLKDSYRYRTAYHDLKTLYTIHNMRYQGIFPKEVLGDLLDLPMDYFSPDQLEFHGNVNFMKGGIVFSDLLSTVSETYATELAYPYFGEGLDGPLRSRSGDLKGITNGIDYELFNPKTDQLLYQTYDEKTLWQKRHNKTGLQEYLGLPLREDVPMFTMITRLADSKGLDLIEFIMDELMELDIQLLILGTGERRFENMFKYYEGKYPEKVSANIFFSSSLAHKFYAAADIFLMPSKFEPCGLGQLIAMRYGTIPIVRETGGLKDTVSPYNQYEKTGTGFGFLNYNAHELLFTIKDAIMLYHKRNTWRGLMKQAMARDSSWMHSADEYIALYHALLRKKD